MKDILKKLRWIILIVAGVYLVWVVSRETKAGKNSSLVVHGTIPVEYQDLVVRSNIGKLNNKESYLSKIGRAPISEFDFNDKYHVIVTKIKTQNSAPLKEMIKELYQSTKISFQVMYEGIGDSYKFDYQIEEPAKSYSKLYLSLNGDSVKTIIKNDTTVAYYLKMKNFAIQYQKNGLVDLIGEENNHGDKIPIMLVFKKRKKFIYFLCISANNPKGGLDKNILNTLYY